MIDAAVVKKLGEIALLVREVMAGCRGHVTFHCSAATGHEPKVELTLCDVTEAKRHDR